MATKDIGNKKQTKEKIIKSKKETIEKLSKLIDSSAQALEVKVGNGSIKIEAKASAISDKKTNQQGSNINDMNIKEVKEEASPIIVSQDHSIPEDDDMLDNTEVYDEGDLASAYERGFIQDALNRHKEKLAPESHPDFDGETCIDCGVDIPVLRLNMGKIRCVDCQDKLEKRKKLYA
jgi:RNA polymerase-binding transcription factor DksA